MDDQHFGDFSSFPFDTIILFLNAASLTKALHGVPCAHSWEGLLCPKTGFRLSSSFLDLHFNVFLKKKILLKFFCSSSVVWIYSAWADICFHMYYIMRNANIRGFSCTHSLSVVCVMIKTISLIFRNVNATSASIFNYIGKKAAKIMVTLPCCVAAW